MAGHSKWSQIKRKKAVVDARRGASFSKLAREIYIAAKLGGPDVGGNFRLRTAINAGKSASMPMDIIKRAIQKATSTTNTENFEEMQYEGYGPGGAAIIIKSMTDNRNRTAGDIRSYFYKCDGNLGETGCVGWMFSENGIIEVDSFNDSKIDFDELFLTVADIGAEDVQKLPDGEFQILTKPNDLEKISQKLDSIGYNTTKVEVSLIPSTSLEINDFDTAKKLIKLVDLLENNDDVQNVFSNFEISEDILERLT